MCQHKDAMFENRSQNYFAQIALHEKGQRKRRTIEL